jgi:hypothetical protein
MAQNRVGDSVAVRTRSAKTPRKSNEINDDVALHFCETRPSIQQYQRLIARIRAASVEDQYGAARFVVTSIEARERFNQAVPLK